MITLIGKIISTNAFILLGIFIIVLDSILASITNIKYIIIHTI